MTPLELQVRHVAHLFAVGLVGLGVVWLAVFLAYALFTARSAR